VQIADWAELLEIDWPTAFRGWREVNSSDISKIPLEVRTAERLTSVISKLIAVGLDDTLSVADYSYALGIALGTVSLDALMETMFYMIQIVEQSLVQNNVSVDEYATLMEYVSATNDPVSSDMVEALQTRHNASFAKFLAQCYRGYDMGFAVLSTILLADLIVLYQHVETLGLRKGVESKKYQAAVAQVTERMIEEAASNFIKRNDHLTLLLLPLEERKYYHNRGLSSMGFLIEAVLGDSDEIQMRVINYVSA